MDRAPVDTAQLVYGQMQGVGPIGELKYDADQVLPMKPSEYFARNCWVGVSFPSPGEAAARHEIGTEHFMWGSGYLHDESTYPTRGRVCGGPSPGLLGTDFQRLLAGNAAAVYRFDLERLAPLAARVGPTFAELSVRYTGIPEGNRSPAFTRA